MLKIALKLNNPM